MYFFYFLFLRHAEASVSATFAACENGMYKWRQKSLPPDVDSLASFSVLINSNEFIHLLTFESGSMNVSSVVGVNSDVSIVFIDVDFARQFCENCNLFIDATFKVAPKVNDDHQYQLLILKAEKFNYASKSDIF